MNILLIDDDPDEQLVLEGALEKVFPGGVDLHHVFDTGAAAEMLSREGFDLIVADNKLTAADKFGGGSNFLRYLVGVGNTTPKLLYTGEDPGLLNEEVDQLIEAGQITFVPKGALNAEVLGAVLNPAIAASSDPGRRSAPDLHSFVRPVTPYADFMDSAMGLINRLHAKYGFRTSMIARTEKDDWVVLYVRDELKRESAAISVGDVFPWQDTLCKRMYEDHQPMAAPDVSQVQAYRDAPVTRDLEIGSYIGIPICRANGELFGTLCAIDPEPGPERIRRDLPDILFESRYLGTILDQALKLEAVRREREKAEAESMSDGLTGLYNRRGWDRLLASEERRAQRYGHPGSVMVIDLDGLKIVNDMQGHEAGDRLIRTAADVISGQLRNEDIVARLGGDEFGVIAVECNTDSAGELTARMRRALDTAGVGASIGCAPRDPKGSFEAAVKLADERMYAEKQARKSAQTT